MLFFPANIMRFCAFEVFNMLNYFLLILASIIGIVVLDDDPSAVSLQEWIFFGVMIYAALGFFREYHERMQGKR